MGWLRKEKDVIGLFVVWVILLQAVVISFATGLHAASRASAPGEAAILCTSRGLEVAQELPGSNHQKPDCQCCLMACRQGCGGTFGGILPTFARVPLPASVVIAAARWEPIDPPLKAQQTFSAKPRAPPLA